MLLSLRSYIGVDLLVARRDRAENVVGDLEIQVRSLLQHAWATFAHDQLYKSDFEVPLQMERDGNRVAAMLEEADEAFARTSRAVRRYSTYYGAYMSPERREEETERLTQVLSFDPTNQRLAHQIARLAMSAQDCERAEAVLAPFVQKWEDSPEAEEAMFRISANCAI